MRSDARRRLMSVALVMTAILVLVVSAAAGTEEDTPIPPGPSTELPDYIGEPAKAHPLPPSQVPQNPSMAANPWNNVHNDTWLSDVYTIPGPLGREPAIVSSRLEAARRNITSPMFTCGRLTFDSRGRIVATCIGPGEGSLVQDEAGRWIVGPALHWERLPARVEAVIAERFGRLPDEQVIGSSIKTRFEPFDGKPALVRLPELNFFDDQAGKPVGIHQQIGRRPIAAFGNSDGDFEMLEWVTAGTGPRLGLLIHHDDAAREFAYDRASPVEKLDRALDEAPVRGWTVVSMKNDWKTVFLSSSG